MVAIDVRPGTAFGLVPAELLQQHTFATQSGKLGAFAVPSGQQDQADDRNGRPYFEYLKGILLLAAVFSVLVLTVHFAGQF